MANIWEKAILILAGNLNFGCSYLITTVFNGDLTFVAQSWLWLIFCCCRWIFGSNELLTTCFHEKTIPYSELSLSLTKEIVLIEKSPQNNNKQTRPKFVKIRNSGSAFRENLWWAAQKLYTMQIEKSIPQRMGLLKMLLSYVLGSSSIWKCRILNFEYRIFVVVFYMQAQWKKSKQIFKIQNSTR